MKTGDYRAWSQGGPRPRPPRLQRRALCPHCGERPAVNRDGTLRRHPNGGKGGSPPPCQGSGTQVTAGGLARVMSWDWKEQPDLEQLAKAVYEISGRTVFIREIDTGGDFYMLVISDYVVSDEEAEGLPVS